MSDPRPVVELLWDAGRRCTGRAPSGASLTIGEGGDYSPADLLALATAGCLMSSFIAKATAAGVTPLSYLSTASVLDHADADMSGRVQVHAYVLAASQQDRAGLEALIDAAKRGSPVACLLGDRADLSIELSVISDASAC